MVGIVPPQIESEPTPDFNDKCLRVVQDWEAAHLPLRTAIDTLQSYLQEALDDGHFANQARSHHIMGYIQHYGGNLTTSIHHYDQAHRLYMRVGNSKRACTIDLNQGENYRFKGDFNRARRLYQKAYEGAESVGDLVIQTMAIGNEGLALIALEKWDKALDALIEGCTLCEQWTEQNARQASTQCELYQGLAVVYMAQNRLDDAWDIALQALAIARNTSQPMDYGFANRIIGEVVTKMGNSPDEDYPSDPDHYFRKALGAFRELHAEAELARTMFAQARSLAARGRRTSAARKLQQVMIIFTQLGMLDDAARAAEAQLAVI